MRLRNAGATLRAHLPRRLPWEPWSVLVPLVLVQWLGIAFVVTQRAHHDGWLFGGGRVQTVYYTTASLLGAGGIAHTIVGYGWPLLLAPVTWFTGANLLAALPTILSLQVLVLVPLGALGAYVLGARSGGRLIGYASALVWTLGPFASLWYFSLHPAWRDQILPVLLGLTARPELPAALALLLAGVLVLRALDEQRLVDAAGAGAAAGFAVAIKSTDVLFLAAPLVAFVAARRFRELGAFAAALVPCALAYLIWTEGSLGHASLLLTKPAHFSSSLLQLNFVYMQFASWSTRVLEWIAVAGFVGLLKRSPVKALFFGTWLGAFVLGEGATRAPATELAFWHLLIPSFPAYCVLTASLPLLWPRADRRLADRFPYRPRWLVPFAVPALAFLLIPLAAVAAASPLHDRHTAARIVGANLFVPIDRGSKPVARLDGGGVTISWRPVGALPARFAYGVYRSPARADVVCTDHGSAAVDCVLGAKWIATTADTSFTESPKTGVFTYRVAVVASARGVKHRLLVLLGPPVNVRVP